MSDTTITLRVPDRLLEKWDAHCNTVDDLDDDVDEDYKEYVANTQTKYPSRSQLIRDSVQLNINSESNSPEQNIEIGALEDKISSLTKTIHSMDTKLDSIKLQLQDQFEDTVPDDILNSIHQKIPQLQRFSNSEQLSKHISRNGKDSILNPETVVLGETYDDKIGWLSSMKMQLDYEDKIIEEAVTQLARDIDDINEFEWEDGDKFYWKSDYY